MSYKISHCLVCGEGQLTPTVGVNTVTFKGQQKDLPLYGSICDTCGSEQASATETRKNKQSMQAFKKEVEGLLTGSEIRAARESFGITQLQAANIFGGGKVAFSKYESDDVNQSDAMDKLIRVAKAVPTAFKWLAQNAGEDAIAEKALLNSFGNAEVRSAMMKDFYTGFKGPGKYVQVSTVEKSETISSFDIANMPTQKLQDIQWQLT